MNSIQNRFVALIFSGILLSILIVGWISVLTIRDKSDRDAASILNLTCREEASQIDATIESIQQSVNLEVSYARKHLDSVEAFLADEAYRKTYTADVERLFNDIAGDTRGAVAYYFRYNKDLVASTQGFLYSKTSTASDFQRRILTDLSLYSEDDDEHVAWYYIPLEKGMPTWLLPYQNRNLGIYMISYVVPLYFDDTFIGVIGMDVDFQIIIDQLSLIRPVTSGYAFLTDENGDIYYHPDFGHESEQAERELHYPGFNELIQGASSGESLVSYEYNGVQKKLAYMELKNGSKLVIAANAADINAERERLVRNIVKAGAIVALSFSVLALLLVKNTIRPLKDLTQAAEAVAGGNLSVQLPSSTSSEVGTLIGAYQKTVDVMREQIIYIDALAHKDDLTGLFNKSAYNEDEEALNKAIREHAAVFAIVMMDVNNLKYINDHFGHEWGNLYLKRASLLLTEGFPMERVYRIGGDEFAVIVTGEALIHVEAKVDLLNRSMAPASIPESPDESMCEHVSAALGVSRFDPATDGSVLQVFERADIMMYRQKRKMKMPAPA